jgi:hypothetical protein
VRNQEFKAHDEAEENCEPVVKNELKLNWLSLLKTGFKDSKCSTTLIMKAPSKVEEKLEYAASDDG